MVSHFRWYNAVYAMWGEGVKIGFSNFRCDSGQCWPTGRDGDHFRLLHGCFGRAGCGGSHLFGRVDRFAARAAKRSQFRSRAGGGQALFTESILLYFAESFDGLEVAALDSGLMAFDFEHRVFVVIEDYGYGLVIVFERSFAGVVFPLESADAHVERGGFDAADAEESPIAVCDGFDEGRFDGVRGFVCGDE